ncbi:MULTISPECIES: hypothetical protein [unclassified Bradyrhizobium]|nr:MULTISPECIES: hypothetical protein [unclassified Bradyrhizobium]
MDAAALAASCLIGLVWFDQWWAVGEAAGAWLGTAICNLIFGGDHEED